jgi:ribonucleoside-triphosphate reductase
MSKSDGSRRFISLDEEKYGKNSILKITEDETYTEGIVIDASTLADLTIKNPQIVECNHMAKTLNGGLFTQVKIPNGSKITEIKKNIEKISSLTSSFKLIMRVPLCGNCGLKDQGLVDKCPTCKSSYII